MSGSILHPSKATVKQENCGATLLENGCFHHPRIKPVLKQVS